MKKLLIYSMLLATVLCACQKEEAGQKVEPKQTIIATVNAPTKLAYSENTLGGGGGMSSVWEEGDTFLAIQDGTTVVEFTLTSGAGTNSATFHAEASGVTASTEWKAVLGQGSIHSGQIHCSYLNQSGQLSGLKNFNHVAASGTGLTPTFDFENGDKYSYVLRVKLPEGTKCIEYTPCAYDKITSTGRDLVNYNSGEQDDYIKSDRMSTITLSSPAAAGDIIYIAVPLIDCSNTRSLTNGNKQHQNLIAGIVMTFLNNTSNDATASNGVVINNDLSSKGGMITTVNCAGMTLMSRPRPADAIEFQTSNVNADYHSASYQRAPSVYTYWAPYNIGATTASESGKFLMFGDWAQKTLSQNPSIPSTGSLPNANQYPYWTTASSGYMAMGHSNAKLIDNANNTTFYSIQSSKYDAARVLWGSAWQMPHIIHLWAIYNNPENTKSIVGSCVRFYNVRTSHSIDVPIAGCYKNGSHNDTAYAVLWSADKNQRSATNPGWDAAYAMCIKNDLGDNKIDRYEMCNAIPIRPVLTTSYVSSSSLPALAGNAPIWEEDN